MGFTGVYIIFLISAQKIDCGYSLEPPHRGGSNEYSSSMFWAEIWKVAEFFYLKIFIFLVVKFSVYLNRHVFVMLFASVVSCVWGLFRHYMFLTSVSLLYVPHLCFVIICSSPLFRHYMFLTSVSLLYVPHLCFVVICSSPLFRHYMFLTSVSLLYVPHLCFVVICSSPLFRCYMFLTSVSSLYVPHLSFFWCLGKASASWLWHPLGIFIYTVEPQ